MTEREWLSYLDAFVTQELTAESVRNVMDAMLRRVNSIIVGHANRNNDETQALVRRIDKARVDYADLRTIIADMLTRIIELEQCKAKAVNDASDDT